jgi:aspartate/methionine/tyrosine aminotransferase
LRITPFAIERWFAQYEFTAKYNLAESCIQAFTLDELLGLVGASWSDLKSLSLGYGESNGGFALRNAIAQLYPGTDEANVLVTVGAIEANFLALNAVVSPGDTVISEFPAYQQLYSVPQACGANVKRWDLRPEDDYEPQLDQLARLLDDRTSLVIINHPHNPTGKKISASKLTQISRQVEDAGAILYSDEVYRGLSLHHNQPSTSARSVSSRSIVIGSMSKAYGLSGLRIGWIIADHSVIEKCWSLRDYTSICNAQLSETLACLALNNHQAVLQRNREIAERNLLLVNQWLDTLNGLITWREPDEGVVGFPHLHFTNDSEEFCKQLMQETGVLLVPGTCFERPEHIRLGFGYATEKLQLGLTLISDYLKKHY